MKHCLKSLLAYITNFSDDLNNSNCAEFDLATTKFRSKLRSISTISMAIALSLVMLMALNPAAPAIAALISKPSLTMIAPISTSISIAVISTTKVTINQNPIVPLDIQQRFGKIVTAMQKMRFCNNQSCFYQSLESSIQATKNSPQHYTATIQAQIDRPSSYLDYADYHFGYVGDRWQLLGAEEYTDVADYVFKGDQYEIFSVHSSRFLKGNIDDARTKSNSLKSGYVPLYYDLLDHGAERGLATTLPPLM